MDWILSLEQSKWCIGKDIWIQLNKSALKTCTSNSSIKTCLNKIKNVTKAFFKELNR